MPRSLGGVPVNDDIVVCQFFYTINIIAIYIDDNKFITILQRLDGFDLIIIHVDMRQIHLVRKTVQGLDGIVGTIDCS